MFKKCLVLGKLLFMILNYDAAQFRMGYGHDGSVREVILETEINMKQEVMKRKTRKG